MATLSRVTRFQPYIVISDTIYAMIVWGFLRPVLRIND
ncbi:hypothetical protein LINPERPRIM_LOCUS23658 [Linum perenne]